MGVKDRVLLIFDFRLYVRLVFHEASIRHAELRQHGELNLWMFPPCLRTAMCRQRHYKRLGVGMTDRMRSRNRWLSRKGMTGVVWEHATGELPWLFD